mmetsp:Transcript_10643/g.44011  ORF Transcript_10643/g.44011 Transcript_10643/m.44011 type:complete len:262 (-) Transcript_10643:754-1539(-)
MTSSFSHSPPRMLAKSYLVHGAPSSLWKASCSLRGCMVSSRASSTFSSSSGVSGVRAGSSAPSTSATSSSTTPCPLPWPLGVRPLSVLLSDITSLPGRRARYAAGNSALSAASDLRVCAAARLACCCWSRSSMAASSSSFCACALADARVVTRTRSMRFTRSAGMGLPAALPRWARPAPPSPPAGEAPRRSTGLFLPPMTSGGVCTLGDFTAGVVLACMVLSIRLYSSRCSSTSSLNLFIFSTDSMTSAAISGANPRTGVM